MSEEKIEARLQEEMERAEKDDEGSREIPILIELEAASNVGPGGMQALEERVRLAQLGIRKKLEELGAARTVRAMTLANAVEARLKPAGIREIAELPDVRRIVWNRAERVTA
jgi:hypothetical protein